MKDARFKDAKMQQFNQSHLCTDIFFSCAHKPGSCIFTFAALAGAQIMVVHMFATSPCVPVALIFTLFAFAICAALDIHAAMKVAELLVGLQTTFAMNAIKVGGHNIGGNSSSDLRAL